MPKTPGEVIREHRERLELTQEQVAVALRVSEASPSHWENNNRHPRRPVATKLDRLLLADGRILKALGYSEPEQPAGRLQRLEEQLHEQAVGLALVMQRLTDVEAELAELRAANRTDREGDGTQP